MARSRRDTRRKTDERTDGRIHLRVIVSPIPVIRLSPIDRQWPMRRPRKSWQGFIAPVDRAYNGLNDLDFIPGLEPRTANNRSRANPRAKRETERGDKRKKKDGRPLQSADRPCVRKVMTAIASRSPAFFVLSNAPPRDLSPCGTNDGARDDERRVALSDVITDTLPVSLVSPKRQPRAVFALSFRADVQGLAFPRGNFDPLESPSSSSQRSGLSSLLEL